MCLSVYCIAMLLNTDFIYSIHPQILEALYDDEFAQNNNLREKFANLEDLMNNDRMDHQQITEL